MKKISIKIHPLQERIQAFQKTPLFQCKMMQKNQDNKLKKIGRNRLLHKDISLPLIHPQTNKENQQPQPIELNQKQNKLLLRKQSHTKNLSFCKNKAINIENRIERMAMTQKLLYDKAEADRMKQIALKKQFMIRDKKLVPQRNCISAQIRKEVIPAPQRTKQLRKVMLRKSKESKLQDDKDKPLHIQANKIAQQARIGSAPHLNRSQLHCYSLQDFLNEWKDKHII